MIFHFQLWTSWNLKLHPVQGAQLSVFNGGCTPHPHDEPMVQWSSASRCVHSVLCWCFFLSARFFFFIQLHVFLLVMVAFGVIFGNKKAAEPLCHHGHCVHWTDALWAGRLSALLFATWRPRFKWSHFRAKHRAKVHFWKHLRWETGNAVTGYGALFDRHCLVWQFDLTFDLILH